MRKEMRKRKEGIYESCWHEQHSWLCRHKGLPKEAAIKVHSFNRYRLPPKLDFQWQEGDLLIEMDMTEYATSWTTTYLARPRSDGHKLQLLLQIRLGSVQSFHPLHKPSLSKRGTGRTLGNGIRKKESTLAIALSKSPPPSTRTRSLSFASAFRTLITTAPTTNLIILRGYICNKHNYIVQGRKELVLPSTTLSLSPNGQEVGPTSSE